MSLVSLVWTPADQEALMQKLGAAASAAGITTVDELTAKLLPVLTQATTDVEQVEDHGTQDLQTILAPFLTEIQGFRKDLDDLMALVKSGVTGTLKWGNG